MTLSKIMNGRTVHYRPGSDERVLTEVLDRGIYRRTGFDVMPGEIWLDLGANIGAFALYCQSRNAVARCYEPEPECYRLLCLNVPDFDKVQVAVTASREPMVPFFVSNKPDVHSRGTIYPVNRYPESDRVPNMWSGELCNKFYDGVKMDIEGSEGSILDEWLLPVCSKLCLEYHTSRDQSIDNMRRRIDQLHKHFKVVKYPPEYDRAMNSGNQRFKSFFDRMIFAWDPR